MPRQQEVQHTTEIVVTEGPHPEPDGIVRIGTSFAIEVRIACTSACRMGSRTLEIRAPDGTTRTVECAGGRATTINLVAATRPGPQTWRLTCNDTGRAVPSHPAASIEWSHEIAPHTATLAIWGMPDTITAGQPMSLKVGATSTAEPKFASSVLAGCSIEIRDAKGVTRAQAQLGKEPWPGTAALQWTELHATAPTDAGVATWTAHLVPDELALAHDAFDCTFTLPVAAPPDHRIEVEVLEAATGIPVPDALVRIGAYRATTSDSGRAILNVPKGRTEIVFWKTGYDAPDHPIVIDADASITITAAVVPEEDPDTHWKG